MSPCYDGQHRFSRSGTTAVMPTILDHERCDCGLVTWGELRQRTLSCPACAEKDAEIEKLRRTGKTWELKANQLHDFCPDHRDKQRGVPCLACVVEGKDAEIARLTAELDTALRNRCEEPIEHGAVAAIREVLKLTDDNCGFIDDDVARVVNERNHLRALVAVGREMADLTLHTFSGVHTWNPELIEVAEKWRSLEGER